MKESLRLPTILRENPRDDKARKESVIQLITDRIVNNSHRLSGDNHYAKFIDNTRGVCTLNK